MKNFNQQNFLKEDEFEEYIVRILGTFEEDGKSYHSIVSDFLRKHNFSNIKAGEIESLIDKLCELANGKSKAFSDRVVDELKVIYDIAFLGFKSVSNKSASKYLKEFKVCAKNSPHISAEKLGARLLD